MYSKHTRKSSTNKINKLIQNEMQESLRSTKFVGVMILICISAMIIVAAIYGTVK